MSVHTAASSALRLLDPEDAHGLAIRGLKLGLGPKVHQAADPVLTTRLAGIEIPTPIGMAAGFDKNAEVANPLLRAGFGFVECGTVTPKPQGGNPRPRLFRLTTDRAVINRLGFNNEGLEAFARRLGTRRRIGVVGANIGANKDSTDRVGDYVTGLKRLWGLSDYFTVNVSSPNTPGLRNLQGGEALTELLGRVSEARKELSAETNYPIFLKVAPDLDSAEIMPIVRAVKKFGLDGLIVGNTTLSRPDTLRSALKTESGGLSGAPLMDLSTRVLGEFYQASKGELTLIGCGGIASGADAYAKIRAGANAVQLYSAMVYAGPALAAQIATDLAARLKAEGFENVEQAVGSAYI